MKLRYFLPFDEVLQNCFVKQNNDGGGSAVMFSIDFRIVYPSISKLEQSNK